MNDASPAAPPAGVAPGGAALRILAVDDDPEEFALIAEGFSRLGVAIDLLTATTAPFAVAEVQLAGPQARPAVALVDIGMPMVDGFDLARVLIGDGVPTILISALVDDRRRQRAADLGAIGLLAKPADGNGYARFAQEILAMAGIDAGRARAQPRATS